MVSLRFNGVCDMHANAAQVQSHFEIHKMAICKDAFSMHVEHSTAVFAEAAAAMQPTSGHPASSAEAHPVGS